MKTLVTFDSHIPTYKWRLLTVVFYNLSFTDWSVVLRQYCLPFIYDWENKKIIASFDDPTFLNCVTKKEAAFVHDGEYLAIGSDDFSVRLWKAETGKHTEADVVLQGHMGIVNQVCWSSKFSYLFSSGVESLIRVWSPFAIPGKAEKAFAPVGPRADRYCPDSPNYGMHGDWFSELAKNFFKKLPHKSKKEFAKAKKPDLTNCNLYSSIALLKKMCKAVQEQEEPNPFVFEEQSPCSEVVMEDQEEETPAKKFKSGDHASTSCDVVFGENQARFGYGEEEERPGVFRRLRPRASRSYRERRVDE